MSCTNRSQHIYIDDISINFSHQIANLLYIINVTISYRSQIDVVLKLVFSLTHIEWL